MSAGATGATNAAPMVADEADSSPLRQLVMDGKGYREVEMEDANSGGESEEEEEGWEGKSRGRPNYKRAAPGAGRQQQSTQEFFRRGSQLSMGELNMFDTPGKTPMKGALARSCQDPDFRSLPWLDRQRSSLACLRCRSSVRSALGLCLFSSLAQASTSHSFR